MVNAVNSATEQTSAAANAQRWEQRFHELEHDYAIEKRAHEHLREKIMKYFGVAIWLEVWLKLEGR